jgi:hypothetical protein
MVLTLATRRGMLRFLIGAISPFYPMKSAVHRVGPSLAEYPARRDRIEAWKRWRNTTRSGHL